MRLVAEVRRLKLDAGKFMFCSRYLLFAGVALSGAVHAQPATSTGAPASNVKVGYIDVKRLIDSSPQFLDAQARIKRDFASQNDTIKANDAKLTALKQRYERENAIMTKEDADALKREVDATERANKRMQDEARAEISERSKSEWNRVSRFIQDTAIEYARAQGYDIVIGSESALFANPRIDITDAVLQRLRQAGTGTAKP